MIHKSTPQKQSSEKVNRGTTIGAEGDRSVSTASFRQHFEMYEEDSCMILQISFSPVFPYNQYLSVGQFTFISLPR